MSTKNYSGENTIKAIIKNIKTRYASINHGHKFSELSDKPFYTKDPVETTLLNNVSVTIKSNNGYASVSPSFAFKNGQTYKVTFDGVEYECVAYPLLGGYVIGNGSIAGASGGNNEPFLCVGGYNLVYAKTSGSHTITIIEHYEEVVPLSEKYVSYKPGKVVDGVFGAEIFNDYSSNTASGEYSHAEGYITTASGNASHAEGCTTVASKTYAHAEGFQTISGGNASHTEGYGSKATGDASHAEGEQTIASGYAQHVQGKYNIEDTAGTYAHIVGNGTGKSKRSNAHTVDWNGNGWFAGSVESNALILSDTVTGVRYKIQVTNGALTMTEVTE